MNGIFFCLIPRLFKICLSADGIIPLLVSSALSVIHFHSLTQEVSTMKWLWKLFILFIYCCFSIGLMSGITHADTNVGGILFNDTTWRLAARTL